VKTDFWVFRDCYKLGKPCYEPPLGSKCGVMYREVEGRLLGIFVFYK